MFFEFALVALIVLLLLLGLLIKRRRRLNAAYESRSLPAKRWIESVEELARAGNRATLAVKRDEYDPEWGKVLRPGDGDWLARLQMAKDESGTAQSRQEDRQGVLDMALRVEAAPSSDERRRRLYFLLVHLYEDYRRTLREEFATEIIAWRHELKQLADEWLTITARKARRDGNIFRKELFPFLQPSARYYGDGETYVGYTKIGIQLEYPSDWNRLIAVNYEAPPLAYFRNEHTNRSRDDVRMRAAEALANKDLVEAKIVLAYCSYADHGYKGRPNYPFKEAVGDVMIADLATMIVRIHHRQRLRLS